MYIYTIIGSNIGYIGGNYKSDNVLSAANKAGKYLFKKLEDPKYAKHKNRKSIKFILRMKDKKGSGKIYSYQVIKQKLKKPILIKVKNTKYYVKFNYVIKTCNLSKKEKKILLGGVGLLENMGKEVTLKLIEFISKDKEKEEKEKEIERIKKEENEKREREEIERLSQMNQMSRISRFINNAKTTFNNYSLKSNRTEDNTAKTDNKDNNENIPQLSEDVIWTKIFKILESLKNNEIISESIMQLTVEEKKVNISGYGIGDIEALNANQLFNGIINKLFLIKTACTFKCSPEIKNGLEKLGTINNEDSEIVKLNKKYQNFLDLCIQFCKENHKKHCENYKNYIAKKKFSKADKELADSKKYEKSKNEIETIIKLSIGGKKRSKKKKEGNDNFLPGLDQNKYNLVESGKKK